MQKAKERPNLVHWRDELVAITKDSSEDFEDATLSVELMRVRCDVCYHEKSVRVQNVSVCACLFFVKIVSESAKPCMRKNALG